MMSSRVLLLLATIVLSVATAQECPAVSVNNEWPGGYHATLVIPFDHEVHGWEMILGFDSPLDQFTVLHSHLPYILVMLHIKAFKNMKSNKIVHILEPKHVCS